MRDGPVEVEKPWLWVRKNPVLAKQESWKGVLPLVVDNAKFLSLFRLEIGVFYMPTLYYISLDLRNIVRIVAFS